MGKEKIEQKEQLNRIINDIINKQTELEKKNEIKSGKEKEKEKKLEEVRDEIKKELRDVNDIRPKGGRANDYITYTKTDVENILNNSEVIFSELEHDEILRLKESLKEKSAKSSIDYLNINLEWVNNLVKKSKGIFEIIIPIEGLQLVTELGDNLILKEWLRVGFDIHKDRQKPIKCEFCKNEISEQRLKELANYFSDTLRNLISEIERIINDISLDKLPKLEIDKGQFYAEFQPEISNLYNDFYNRMETIRDEFKNLRQKLIDKKNNPTQEINYSFDDIIKTIKNINNIIFKINEIIKKHNEKSQDFENRRRDDAYKLEISNISKIKSEYNAINDELEKINSETVTLNRNIKTLETKKMELELKLKEHSIVAEEFNKLLSSFLGRQEIRLEPVEDGYRIKRNGNIANNLSEGERNAIALIFFLIKLEEENFDRQNGIIVIDDPVSSFDSQNLYGAFGLIKERLKRINPLQIFIFTHNFPFFRLVRNWMKYETRNNEFYQIKTKIKIKQMVRYSIIEKIDKLLTENTSEYSYLFKLIYKRATEEDSNLEKDYILPNVIRKFLENYLSFKIPVGQDTSYRKFKKLCEDYPNLSAESLSRIEYYCQEQSHPLHQDSLIDFDERSLGEIQSVCKATIEMVKKTDPNHYKHLLSECGFSSNETQ